MDYIDWKQSYFYRELILKKMDEKNQAETEEHIREDELDLLTKMIRNFKMKKPNFNQDELLALTPHMMKKCYETIKHYYRQILT